jgi:hypothetical protein
VKTNQGKLMTTPPAMVGEGAEEMHITRCINNLVVLEETLSKFIIISCYFKSESNSISFYIMIHAKKHFLKNKKANQEYFDQKLKLYINNEEKYRITTTSTRGKEVEGER